MRIDGAIPRTRSRISASARRACSRASTTSPFAASGSVVDPVRREAEVDREHDEPLLRAVVEVALDPAELARLDVEDGLAALLERLDPLLEGARPGVAQEAGDHRAVEGHEPLGRERGHGEQDEARDSSEASRDRPTARPGSSEASHGTPVDEEPHVEPAERDRR